MKTLVVGLEGLDANPEMVRAGGEALAVILAEPLGVRSQYERMALEVWAAMNRARESKSQSKSES